MGDSSRIETGTVGSEGSLASSGSAIHEPTWHVHAQSGTAWEVEHVSTFAEAVAAGHAVIDRATEVGRLSPAIIAEGHMCLARLPEDSVQEGTWYHYEYHPYPNLFIWLGQVDGGDCHHCRFHDENSGRMGWFGALKFLLFERRHCKRPNHPGHSHHAH